MCPVYNAVDSLCINGPGMPPLDAPSGVSGNQKQAVDQGGLCGSGGLKKFRELPFVEAVMPRSLPLVAHAQALRLRIEHKAPAILIGRGGPAPALVKLTVDRGHVGSLSLRWPSIARLAAEAWPGLKGAIPGPSMTSTLTPATCRATFAIGNEQAARRVVDLLNERFFEGQAAIAAFERPDGRWDVTVHFAEAPDQASIRELVGIAAGDDVAQHITFDTVEARDWVKATLEELVPVRAGRFIVHGHHDRKRISANKLGIEIEAALAFGTGHHGTTRGCLLLLDCVLKAHDPPRV